VDLIALEPSPEVWALETFWLPGISEAMATMRCLFEDDRPRVYKALLDDEDSVVAVDGIDDDPTPSSPSSPHPRKWWADVYDFTVPLLSNIAIAAFSIPALSKQNYIIHPVQFLWLSIAINPCGASPLPTDHSYFEREQNMARSFISDMFHYAHIKVAGLFIVLVIMIIAGRRVVTRHPPPMTANSRDVFMPSHPPPDHIRLEAVGESAPPPSGATSGSHSGVDNLPPHIQMLADATGEVADDAHAVPVGEQAPTVRATVKYLYAGLMILLGVFGVVLAWKSLQKQANAQP
jgi:hypothetical protein